MDSLDKAARASVFGVNTVVKRNNKPSEERVNLLAERYEKGLDLWTGLPLKSTADLEPDVALE